MGARHADAANQFLPRDVLHGPAIGYLRQRVRQRHLFQNARLHLDLGERVFEFAGAFNHALFQVRVQEAEFVEELLVAAFEQQAAADGVQGLNEILGFPRLQDEPVNLSVIDGIDGIFDSGGAGEQDASGCGLARRVLSNKMMPDSSGS